MESVHDCSDGGLAVALAEKAFAKNVGVRVNLVRMDSQRSLCCLERIRAALWSPATQSKCRESNKWPTAIGISADVIGETISGTA